MTRPPRRRQQTFDTCCEQFAADPVLQQDRADRDTDLHGQTVAEVLFSDDRVPNRELVQTGLTSGRHHARQSRHFEQFALDADRHEHASTFNGLGLGQLGQDNEAPVLARRLR